MPPRWQALSLNRNEILNTYDGHDLLTGYSISITNRLEDEVLFSGDDGRCLAVLCPFPQLTDGHAIQKIMARPPRGLEGVAGCGSGAGLGS